MALDLAGVLALSRALQRAKTLTELLAAAREAVVRFTRYRTMWLTAVEEGEDGRWCRILGLEGPFSETIWERTPRFPVDGDPFLVEILRADSPVIVDDMRVDPRTDKKMVERTECRTILNIPVRFGEAVGVFSVGTFGPEGVVPATEAEIDVLTVIAAVVAPSFDRVRALALKEAAEAAAKAESAKSRLLEAQLHHVQRLESVGQIAGGIAHDFNNLLTAIAGHAELALAEEPDGAVAESLQVVMDATKRGSHLTHNLLSFSRRRVLLRRGSDLNETIARGLALVRPAVRAHIDLRFIPAPEPVPVFVDDVELEHALLNLVTNARDAIEGTGTITVKVGTEHLGDELVARFEGKIVGDCATVEVRDTGQGMSEATLAEIFEPFFSTKVPGRGTGLGLATVRSIVEEHGGVVAVESEPGRGSSFKIYLPLAKDVPAPREETAPLSSHGQGETILLAEDDDLVRALLVRVLRGQGYNVLEFSDGQAAIEAFRAQSGQIDLVLTDLMMPRRSGLELVNAVLAFRQGTPIVVMSGYTSDKEGAARLQELGLPVISKPTTPTEVLTKIRKALE